MFDARSAAIAGQVSGQRRRARPPRKSPTGQALELQSIALRDGIADSTPVHVKAALMRAWVDLQEIVMAIRGQGKPKPVEARNAKPKRARESAPTPVNVNGAVDKGA